jgi:cytoskeletal protein CcmA (bactofilin family)
MGFFGRDNSSNNRSSSMASSKNSIQDQINLVGEGTVFEGTLRAESDVRASGKIVGKLDVDGKAIVAESGVVDGEIVATNADVAGRVEGEIHVSERLVLKSTAHVDGNIETDRLVVEEGAVFTGECRMGEAVSAEKSAASKKTTSGSSKGSGSKGSASTSGSGSGSGSDSSKTASSGSPSSKDKSKATKKNE